jgi:hypothetical protein
MIRSLIAALCCACLQLMSTAQWQTLGTGVDHGVRSLTYDSVNTRLYVFGRFSTAGGLIVNGTAFWDGTAWNAMGQGVDYPLATPVWASTIVGDSVLVSGVFPFIEDVPDSRKTAFWDGSQWQSAGPGGSSGVFRGMVHNEDGITVAGCSDTIAGVVVNSLARYQNGSWTALSAYPSFSHGLVCYNSVIKYQGQYIAGGNINVPGLREIGWLDGDTLRQLGPGILGDSWVNELVEYQDLLYVGGEFHAGAGNAATGIMTWDGEQFANPFPAVQYVGMVHTMTVANGELFVSGQVIIPGMPDYYQLLRYDGERICLFGRNFNTAIRSLAASPERLYFAPNVQSLAPGGTPLGWIASYDLAYPGDTCIMIATGMPEQDGPGPYPDQVVVFPNPSQGTVLVQLGPAWAAGGPVLMEVYDATGKLLLVPVPHPHTGKEAFAMDLRNAGPGIRFIRIRSADGRMDVTRSILLQ